MVRNELIDFIQEAIDDIIETYEENNVKIFTGYTCKISGDINYNFLEPQPKQIEASVFIGSATRQNDLENKYNQKFTINIVSEINGGDVALKLFNIFFTTYTRTYLPNANISVDFGDFQGKLYLTSPVYMGKYENIQSNFINYMVMNGDIEYAKDVVLGASYSLSIDGINYIGITPRQPYCLKEAVGGTDIQIVNTGTPMLFSKSSDQMTINIVLIYELDGDTNDTTHDTLFNKLFDECYGASNQKYTFKCVCGGNTKTISNLICVRGQHLFDEATGENVLSLQFKVGA